MSDIIHFFYHDYNINQILSSFTVCMFIIYMVQVCQ